MNTYLHYLCWHRKIETKIIRISDKPFFLTYSREAANRIYVCLDITQQFGDSGSNKNLLRGCFVKMGLAYFHRSWFSNFQKQHSLKQIAD